MASVQDVAWIFKRHHMIDQAVWEAECSYVIQACTSVFSMHPRRTPFDANHGVLMQCRQESWTQSGTSVDAMQGVLRDAMRKAKLIAHKVVQNACQTIRNVS